ncbi:DUF1102 domain-containing protein [Halorubrum sp. DTA46]|uniref:DUF1102 domain-containing protein n=1 Tax=Halorubrum sp. DTA46 TaxID=3402162 RepID=UPI003AAFE7D1
MKRRSFVLGAGSAAATGSAILGSGAFSRVESQRQVTVQLAEDTDAYLGLKPIDTPNSNNFVELDENGHLKIDIGDYDDGTYERPTGVGVNSDSNTRFDGMFDICNQGKAQAEVCFMFDYDDMVDHGDPNLDFRDEYDKTLLCPNRKKIDVGECVRVSIDLASYDVDATSGDPLFDGDVLITADADGAGDTGD